MQPKSKPKKEIVPYGKRYFPDEKPYPSPKLNCPNCPIVIPLWLHVADGRILCYSCGYPLPERFENPLND